MTSSSGLHSLVLAPVARVRRQGERFLWVAHRSRSSSSAGPRRALQRTARHACSRQEQERAEGPGRLLVVVRCERESGPCSDARSPAEALARCHEQRRAGSSRSSAPPLGRWATFSTVGVKKRCPQERAWFSLDWQAPVRGSRAVTGPGSYVKE